MGVSRSAYYDWLHRLPTITEKNDQALTEIIVSAFKKSRATYGTRRLRKVLFQKDRVVSRRRIGRLMRDAKLTCTRLLNTSLQFVNLAFLSLLLRRY
jgi:putative transposase